MNELLLPAVEKISVHRCDTFPTHSPVQICIATEKLQWERRRLRKPTDAAEEVQNKIEGELIKEEEGRARNALRKMMMTDLHEMMDEATVQRHERLEEAMKAKDTDRLWALITAAAEDVFVRFLGLSSRDALRMKGRSKVQIEVVNTRFAAARTDCQVSKLAAEYQRYAGRHMAQANRLTNIARRLLAKDKRTQGGSGEARRELKDESKDEDNHNTFVTYVNQAIDMIQGSLNRVAEDSNDGAGSDAFTKEEQTEASSDQDGGEDEQDIEPEVTRDRCEVDVVVAAIGKVSKLCIKEPLHAVAVVRVADTHREAATKLEAKAVALRRAETRTANDDPRKGVRHIGRRLDAAPAPPLLFVKRDQYCTDGGLPGTITTDPKQVDGVVARAWNKIYEGNTACAANLVAAFIGKYKPYIYLQEQEEELQHVTGQDVWDNFQAIVPSAGGMDGWMPMELKLLSKLLCEWVAVLYRLIEDGAAWPRSTRDAKNAYLEKEGSTPGEVMSYRPLTIMAPLYRRWASMRLRALEGWVQKWALPEMYAGVAGQGSADATY